MQYRDQLELARRLAGVAEHEIMPRYQRCSVSLKPDGTEVTDADRAAEEAVRSCLARECPDDRVAGEEFGGEVEPGGGPCWIIDPIDGTAAFTLGMPTFGVLIAYCMGDEPVAGVIHMPAMGETVYAAAAQGCWFQRAGEEATRVSVAPVSSISASVASSSGLHSSDVHAEDGHVPYRLSEVVRRARKFRFVGDCLQHAMVCRGRVHLAVDSIMAPWDIAALVPCVEEAGGVATSMRGERDGIVRSGSFVSSSDRSLHDEALAILSPG